MRKQHGEANGQPYVHWVCVACAREFRPGTYNGATPSEIEAPDMPHPDEAENNDV